MRSPTQRTSQLSTLGIIHTLMKHTIGLFVASLLLAGCASHLSDSNISQKAVGIWTMPHTTAKMDVRDDGSYVTRGESQTATGSWRVEDGCIVAVVTNLSDHASVRSEE